MLLTTDKQYALKMPAQLAQLGLNIFASAPTTSLPEEIRAHLPPAATSSATANGQTICLVGHGGRELWKHLPHPLNAEEHPIDTFVTKQIERFEPTILFPHTTNIFPLTKLGRFLNIAAPSKLGLDIHPIYGPWFAYRAAFLTTQTPNTTQPQKHTSPCETCEAKPCITKCPSQAVNAEDFNLTKCADYRLSTNTTCHDTCHARQACPVGKEHQYTPEQLRYHMVRPAHLARLKDFSSKE